MADNKYHSLVYRDTDMQRYLKDILIPLIGYRDVGHTLGSFRDSIDKLKVEVKAMQIPPKTKFYNHQSFLTPVYIKIVPKSYEYPDVDAFEPIQVTIEFDRTIPSETGGDNTEKNYSFSIIIPGQAQSSGFRNPYCLSCNSNVYADIKTVQVIHLNDVRNTDTDVFGIVIPAITDENSSQFRSGSVTVYSENRNVELVTTWDTADLDDPNIVHTNAWDVTMGTIPYFDPVEDVDKLVYSNEIRWIQALTLPALEYLQETGNTDVETLYVGREDDDSTYQGRIFFNTVDDFKRELPTIYKVFGYNWRQLDIEFAPEVTNIDGLLAENQDIVGTPRTIVGEGIISAKELFRDSGVKYIENQEDLFTGMPNLKYLDSAFEGCGIKAGIQADLINQNKNLLSVRRMFANTGVTDTDAIWQMTDLELDGMNCFFGCKLSDDVDPPDYWVNAGNEPMIEIYTKAGFDRLRDEIISYWNGNLSTFGFNFINSFDMTEMFAASEITHTPKTLIMRAGTSMIGGFKNCPKLESITPTTFKELAGFEDFSEMFMDDLGLTSIPADLELPKSIINYTRTFSGLTNVTGQAPTQNGVNLWELAGTSGYPAQITGVDCFARSNFANITSIPAAWGGQGA